MNQTKIKCPNCNVEIDVNDIVYHQLEADLKVQFNARLTEERQKYEKQEAALKLEKEEFAKKKEKENELFQERLNSKIKEEKSALEKTIKSKLINETAEQLALLQKELNEKSEQVKELNRSKAEIEKLKREKLEIKDLAEANAQKLLNETLNLEREKIRKLEQDKNELALKELQKQLDDQKKLTEEMKRKQEQGSIQLQGEVQELAIEEWLRNNFPLDVIAEIKKGARGADCIQTIHTRTKQNCGTIYYESKRTKEFGKDWIEKFKNDIREQAANIGVLVTDVLPSDMERMGLRDGIWICTYEEFKGLCFVLRESIIKISLAVSSQENKGEKMTMLYDYLTSNEFRLQIEGIVEGFTQMQIDLDSERRSIMGHWRKREKQIQKVLLNTNFMYNSIKGIAGSAIQPIRQLELPEISDKVEDLD